MGNGRHCLVDGCGNAIKARGLCRLHYQQWLRTRDPVLSAVIEPRKRKRECAVDGCSRWAEAKGYCHTHYVRWRKDGDPGSAVIDYEARPPECTVDDCERDVYARGWCVIHYENNRLRGGPLNFGPGQGKRPYRVQADSPCSVEGCARRSSVRGMCAMHAARDLRNGHPGPAGLLRRPKGQGRYINKDGYVVVTGARLEHRVVMEQVIGRPLESHENVHHINGVRHDNRPENLALWVTTQPSGQDVHDLVAWAHQILDTYEPLLPRLPS